MLSNAAASRVGSEKKDFIRDAEFRRNRAGPTRYYRAKRVAVICPASSSALPQDLVEHERSQAAGGDARVEKGLDNAG